MAIKYNRRKCLATKEIDISGYRYPGSTDKSWPIPGYCATWKFEQVDFQHQSALSATPRWENTYNSYMVRNLSMNVFQIYKHYWRACSEQADAWPPVSLLAAFLRTAFFLSKLIDLMTIIIIITGFFFIT